MSKFAQGKFVLKNPDKYIGKGNPTYRSSWEWAVMNMCDNNPSIQKWASEAVKIPYRCPLTGKHTIYVPDFFVNYVDKNGKGHAEVWEVKPAAQAIKEKVGRNKVNQAHYVKNMAKWEAARAWCSQQGISFRIISENDIFHNGKR
jgi:TnsA endonuclease N terminal